MRRWHGVAQCYLDVAGTSKVVPQVLLTQCRGDHNKSGYTYTYVPMHIHSMCIMTIIMFLVVAAIVIVIVDSTMIISHIIMCIIFVIHMIIHITVIVCAIVVKLLVPLV